MQIHSLILFVYFLTLHDYKGIWVSYTYMLEWSWTVIACAVLIKPQHLAIEDLILEKKWSKFYIRQKWAYTIPLASYMHYLPILFEVLCLQQFVKCSKTISSVCRLAIDGCHMFVQMFSLLILASIVAVYMHVQVVAINM